MARMNANKTPVVFIIFNRPITTQKVFDAIREDKPSKLFVIADGPRENRSDDEINCKKAREIIDNVDWECEVFKNYSNVNLGCGKRVSSGLDWVFENCEEAIILEDDCVPSEAFFRFCRELLVRYKYDTRIMHISGSRFNSERIRNDDSYIFSRHGHIWGWATWKRAWQLNDHEMKLWPRFRDEGWVNDLYDNKEEVEFTTRGLNECYNGKIDTWDYQWAFTLLSNSGLSIIPRENLVSNIGIGEDSTHVKEDILNHNNRRISEDFKIIKHPSFIIRNNWFDSYHYKNHFKIYLSRRISVKLRKILSSFIK
jgi:hypothetical protein